MKPRHALAIAAAVLIALAVWYYASTYDLLGGPPRPDELAGAPDAVPRVDPALKTNHAPAPNPAAATPPPSAPPRAPDAAPQTRPTAPLRTVTVMAHETPTTEPWPARTAASTATDAGLRYAVNREGIRSAINSAIPEMKECYESWHKLDPSLEGRMTIGFTLFSDGGDESSFAGVHVMADPGIEHVAFEGCVLSVVSSLRFDPPEGGGSMMVRYPLMFASANPDADAGG